MDKEQIEIKKSIAVNILLIIGIIMTIWDPKINNIPMNCLPTIIFLIVYLKKDNPLQVFLNIAILGMCAIILNNFIFLFIMKFVLALLMMTLIRLLESQNINYIVKGALIVFISTLLNCIIFSFMRPIPYFYQLLTIALPRAAINGLLITILFIGFKFYKKK